MRLHFSFSFFFSDTATTDIYTLSLHDALPIWRVLLRLFENVPQVLFALAVELGHDLRPGDRMEVRVRLRCDGLGEERLARPRGTVQEDPFRRFDAEPLEQLRMP